MNARGSFGFQWLDYLFQLIGLFASIDWVICFDWLGYLLRLIGLFASIGWAVNFDWLGYWILVDWIFNLM